jgi:hypothetical protein
VQVRPVSDSQCPGPLLTNRVGNTLTWTSTVRSGARGFQLGLNFHSAERHDHGNIFRLSLALVFVFGFVRRFQCRIRKARGRHLRTGSTTHCHGHERYVRVQGFVSWCSIFTQQKGTITAIFFVLLGVVQVPLSDSQCPWPLLTNRVDNTLPWTSTVCTGARVGQLVLNFHSTERHDHGNIFRLALVLCRFHCRIRSARGCK